MCDAVNVDNETESDAENGHGQDGSQSESGDEKSSEEPLKKRKKMAFQEPWMKTHSWLANSDDSMRCTACTRTGKTNAMTMPGCQNNTRILLWNKIYTITSFSTMK